MYVCLYICWYILLFSAYYKRIKISNTIWSYLYQNLQIFSKTSLTSTTYLPDTSTSTCLYQLYDFNFYLKHTSMSCVKSYWNYECICECVCACVWQNIVRFYLNLSEKYVNKYLLRNFLCPIRGDKTVLREMCLRLLRVPGIVALFHATLSTCWIKCVYTKASVSW